MDSGERYPFLPVNGGDDQTSLLPMLPLTLKLGEHSVAAPGLLDTGATVNVLPYGLGVQLGGIWEEQTVPLRLTGNLGRYEARALLLEGTVGAAAPVRLAFAWTRAENVPLILGQVNFFLEFDVCFYRAQRVFEVPRKSHEEPAP